MTKYVLEIQIDKDVPTSVIEAQVAFAVRQVIDPTRAYSPSSSVKVTVLEVKDRPLKESRWNGTRQHPFDGPEVFDDEPKPKPKLASGGYIPNGTITTGGTFTVNTDGKVSPRSVDVKITDEITVQANDIMELVNRAIGEDFPHLQELFRVKGQTEPPAEGDWQLNGDDQVGKD